MEFNFKDAQIEYPKENYPILIKYYKGNKANWRSQPGSFYTQGYISRVGDGIVWSDYADRLITVTGDGGSKNSKNRIIKWAYIEEEVF